MSLLVEVDFGGLVDGWAFSWLKINGCRSIGIHSRQEYNTGGPSGRDRLCSWHTEDTQVTGAELPLLLGTLIRRSNGSEMMRSFGCQTEGFKF